MTAPDVVVVGGGPVGLAAAIAARQRGLDVLVADRARPPIDKPDPATGKMDGMITVDAASGDSGHSIRDDRMKSSILETDKFPEISFAPRQVVSHGGIEKEFPVKVQGLLHGVQHDLTVNATVSRDGNNVTIHCDFVIPCVAWGLEDPSIMMFKVAKEVAIDVTTVARLRWQPAE